MGRAAAELGVVTSALSQQISRLEVELATRLLERSASGVTPTDAGVAFFQQAQMCLRHADGAVHAAKKARLSGHVSVGLAPSTAGVLALPFMLAMRDRYPDVRLHMVENLSGHLTSMLHGRLLDLAVVFDTGAARRWSVLPLVEEQLFLIGRPDMPAMPKGARAQVTDLQGVPLVLPSRTHGLHALVVSAFARAGCEPTIALEIDGLAVLMDAVGAGLGVTIQPGAATTRLPQGDLARVAITDHGSLRSNLLVSLSDDELSPAGLAARVVLADVARRLVEAGAWPGGSVSRL